MATIKVEKTVISVIKVGDEDYISLTDMAKSRTDEPNSVICNWMRNRNTLEYLGLWENLYNCHFKPIEFEGFRRQAGLNSFSLSPQKWSKATDAIGIICKSGRSPSSTRRKPMS